MKNTITLTGWAAIAAKYQDETIVLNNYNTPIDPAADDITEERARELAHEDHTLIWCEIKVARPDRKSLKEVLQKISDASFICVADPVVTFDPMTGRWAIRSGLTYYWRAPWVIEVAYNPPEWAGNLFADQHGDINPETALDGCTDEWLMEYAVGEYKEN